MKKSLIPKKHIVPGRDYWCMYNNDHSVLSLMNYANNGIFYNQGEMVLVENIRVMFEGYINVNKSRIPRKYLVPERCYWCKYKDDRDLKLMRYKEDGSFYLFSHDCHLPPTDLKLIFEDYEN